MMSLFERGGNEDDGIEEECSDSGACSIASSSITTLPHLLDTGGNVLVERTESRERCNVLTALCNGRVIAKLWVGLVEHLKGPSSYPHVFV
jgi:hypothetical protein